MKVLGLSLLLVVAGMVTYGIGAAKRARQQVA